MTCPRFVVIIIIVFAFEFGNADCHLDGAIGKAPGYILNTLCLRDSHIYLRSTLTIYQKFATTSRRTTGRCAAPEFHYNCVKNRLSLYPGLCPVHVPMGDVAGVLHPRRRLATRIAWRDRKEMW